MTRTKRRRTLRITRLAVAACALLAACSDGPVAAPNVPRPTPLADPLAQKVADMGFRVDMIVDQGDHFLVEGDIVISKADLLGPTASRGTPSQPGPVFQWHTNEVVAQTKMAQGLRVDIGGIATNSEWVTALRDAMQQYRGTYETKIHLVEGSPGDITVTFNPYLASSVVAVASWPASGAPGGTIEINPYYSLSASKKLWTAVHEIGHTLGYRHANWDDLNEEAYPEHYAVGANFIPGTLDSDPNSVMVGGGAKSWAGFSQYDGIANRYLYPGLATTYSYQGYTAAGHPSLEWSPVSDATSYHVYQVYYVEEFEYDPSFPEGGYYHMVRHESDLGYVTGTSFIDTGSLYTGNGDCGAYYDVYAVYPSGKHGAAAGSNTFDIC